MAPVRLTLGGLVLFVLFQYVVLQKFNVMNTHRSFLIDKDRVKSVSSLKECPQGTETLCVLTMKARTFGHVIYADVDAELAPKDGVVCPDKNSLSVMFEEDGKAHTTCGVVKGGVKSKNRTLQAYLHLTGSFKPLYYLNISAWSDPPGGTSRPFTLLKFPEATYEHVKKPAPHTQTSAAERISMCVLCFIATVVVIVTDII